jgi:hypothetical protein
MTNRSQLFASSFSWFKICGTDGRSQGLDWCSGSQAFSKRFHNASENSKRGRSGFFPLMATSSITVGSALISLKGRFPVNTCQERY